MNKMKLSPPWEEFAKKVKALFKGDEAIDVDDLYESEDEAGRYILPIGVKKHEKLVALDRALPKEHEFGNITVFISLYDEENEEDIEEDAKLYSAIFEGNPNFKDTKAFVDPAGYVHTYVRFEPKVLQFFNDDLSSYDGNWSGLAQDVAKELFDNDYRAVNFCTAPVTPEPEDGEMPKPSVD